MKNRRELDMEINLRDLKKVAGDLFYEQSKVR
jgi:hypothetical protein